MGLLVWEDGIGCLLWEDGVGIGSQLSSYLFGIGIGCLLWGIGGRERWIIANDFPALITN